MNAPDILRAAADTIDQRGRERDMPGGERSMGRAVGDVTVSLADHRRARA